MNEGRKSAHLDLLDIGNQSDNVAFLHAMGAEGETIEDSRSIFENHLKTCFAEYLFLENEKDALFVLGIAFHGIMDSFTPSHMNFQKYTEQDMGLHAQGDVIPVLGKFNKDGELKEGNFSEKEKVRFDPGQFTKEGLPSQGLCIYKKRFSGNESHYLNPVEDKMLEIFFFISDIEELKGNVWNAVGNIDNFLKAHTIKQINDIFDNGNYRYSPKSYAYSEAAIRVICDIYKYLSKKREECKNYSEYKNNKQEIVNDALDIWKKVYDKKARMDEDGNIIDEDGNIVFLFDNQKKTYAMKTLREDHILSLYSKDSGLDEKYEKYKESNEYKEWAAQQDIDRLNRLKG